VRCHRYMPLALANCISQSHHEIRPQKASSSDPPTTGSSGDPRVTDQEIASHRASREPAIFDRRPCHHCLFTASASALHKRALPCNTAQDEPPSSRIAAGPVLRRRPTKAQTLETPLGRCCHTDPAKHHPSSGTTEKG